MTAIDHSGLVHDIDTGGRVCAVKALITIRKSLRFVGGLDCGSRRSRRLSTVFHVFESAVTPTYNVMNTVIVFLGGGLAFASDTGAAHTMLAELSVANGQFGDGLGLSHSLSLWVIQVSRLPRKVTVGAM